jgi:dephospho-CoA kinase
VFRDPEARQRLNAILHPAIRMEVANRSALLAQNGHEFALVDAALLAENGRKDPYLSGLIVVNCPEDTRVQRLVALRGIDENEARRRIVAQTPPEKKIPIADWVIENSGTIEALEAEVERVAKELARHGR